MGTVVTSFSLKVSRRVLLQFFISSSMVIIITTILSGNMSAATGLDSSRCPTDYGGERVGVVCFMAPPLASSHPSPSKETLIETKGILSQLMRGAEKTRGRSFTSKEKNKCIYKVECVLPLLAG